jgi:hypothetical protein
MQLLFSKIIMLANISNSLEIELGIKNQPRLRIIFNSENSVTMQYWEINAMKFS